MHQSEEDPRLRRRTPVAHPYQSRLREEDEQEKDHSLLRNSTSSLGGRPVTRRERFQALYLLSPFSFPFKRESPDYPSLRVFPSHY
jgi:hypothetical protein